MKRESSIGSSVHHFKELAKPLTLFFFAIGIWFIKHEGVELIEVKKVLITAKWQWVLIGIGLTALYILLQG